MKVYRIMVPVNRNDGLPYNPDAVLQKAIDLAGGYTFHTSPVDGAWEDGATGKLYVEPMRALDVCTTIENVHTLASFLKKDADQLSVMVIKLGKALFV